LPNGLHLVAANTLRLANNAIINAMLVARRWRGQSFREFFLGISFSDLLAMFEPMPVLRSQLAFGGRVVECQLLRVQGLFPAGAKGGAGSSLPRQKVAQKRTF
jgi:hypothetical protein